MNFGVYVRSIGERTERLCLESCYQHVDPSDVHLLKNYFPSYNAYREMFNRALKSEYEWFLAIDADVVLYKDWFKIVKKNIEEHKTPETVFKFTYLVNDYILEQPVDRGNHIYNNAFTKYALKELEKNIFISKFPKFLKKRYSWGRYLKPESSIRHKIREKYNLEFFQVKKIIGNHRVEQYLSEVFRSFVVRSNRNPIWIKKYDFLQKSYQKELLKQNKVDRYVANLGWHYGVNHSIDRVNGRKSKSYQQVLEEFEIQEREELTMTLEEFYEKYPLNNSDSIHA